MTNDEYTSSVDRGEWPDDRRVPLDEPFRNASGSIQNLVLKPMTSVAAIESAAGTVRSNHYHLTDWHYIYVASGSLAYLERPVGSSEIPHPVVFRKGEMFFTPPMAEHAIVFLEDTLIITMAKNVRSHESHEADLVRVSFLTPEIVKHILESLCA
jgi:dTDP-4-dehydrorhamnose 3,5-epimerase-like enzyme